MINHVIPFDRLLCPHCLKDMTTEPQAEDEEPVDDLSDEEDLDRETESDPDYDHREDCDEASDMSGDEADMDNL